MLSKKYFLTGVCILMLASFAFAQFSEILVEREIPEDGVLPGEEIEIKLNVNLNGEEPSSIIVFEEIPSEWEFVKANPSAKEIDGKIKWLLFGSSLQDSMILKYTLKAPANFSEMQEINGGWKILGITAPTLGASLIPEGVAPAPEETPSEEPAAETPKEDYTMYIIGGVLLIVIIAAVVLLVKKKNK